MTPFDGIERGSLIKCLIYRGVMYRAEMREVRVYVIQPPRQQSAKRRAAEPNCTCTSVRSLSTIDRHCCQLDIFFDALSHDSNLINLLLGMTGRQGKCAL